jgi:hypothetical protein
VPHLRQHALEPAGVPSSFDPHPPPLQNCANGAGFSTLVLQPALHQLSRLLIQYHYLLVARMQIYNLYVLGSFPPSLCCFERSKFSRRFGADTVIESAWTVSVRSQAVVNHQDSLSRNCDSVACGRRVVLLLDRIKARLV